MRNYHNKTPILKDGGTINGGNYSQRLPDSKPFDGKKNVIINDGSFVNCLIPKSFTVNGGLHCQISYCKHLHPDWSELPDCPEFPEVCDHVTEKVFDEDGLIAFVRENTVLSNGVKNV